MVGCEEGSEPPGWCGNLVWQLSAMLCIATACFIDVYSLPLLTPVRPLVSDGTLGIDSPSHYTQTNGLFRWPRILPALVWREGSCEHCWYQILLSCRIQKRSESTKWLYNVISSQQLFITQAYCGYNTKSFCFFNRLSYWYSDVNLNVPFTAYLANSFYLFYSFFFFFAFVCCSYSWC